MPGLFADKLTVCVDFASLPCFVGLRSTLLLEQEFNLRIVWLPMTTALSRASDLRLTANAADPLAAYKRRRQIARQKWATEVLTRDCVLADIPLAHGARAVDSAVAAMGLLYLRNQYLRNQHMNNQSLKNQHLNNQGDSGTSDAGPLVQRLFEVVFREARDPDITDVCNFLNDSSFADYAAGKGPTELTEWQNRLQEAGIFMAPAYVLDGEIFMGRQHLPLLRWHLGGRPGTPPG